MKKITITALFITCFIFIYEACRKTETANIYFQNASLIAAAKAAFTISPPNSGASTQPLNERQLLAKTPLWNEAYVVQLSTGKAVVVPLSFSKNFATHVLNDSAIKLPLSKISKLLMWKDAKQKFHEEVITGLADSNYIRKPSVNFSGITLVEDWYGNSLNKFSYHNGNISKAVNTATAKQASVNLEEQETCYYEDWYTPVYNFDEDGNETISYEYSYTEDLGCFPDGSGDGGGEGGEPSGGDYGVVVTSGAGGSPPPPPPTVTPCNTVGKLISNSSFQTVLNQMKANTSLNYETGDLYTNNADGSLALTPEQGSPGNPFINITVTNPIDGYMHSHFGGTPATYSIFSATDLQAVYLLYTGSKMIDPLTFTAGVVTSQGTSYILMITNPTAFAAFGNSYLTSSNFNYFESKIFAGLGADGYGILELLPAATNELNFTTLLSNMNTGLTLFKGNAAMNDFEPVGIDANGNEKTIPCP